MYVENSLKVRLRSIIQVRQLNRLHRNKRSVGDKINVIYFQSLIVNAH